MKKTGLSVTVFLLIMVLMTGCVSTEDMTKLTPLNLYGKKRFSTEKIYFIGEGRAETLRQAELLSYVDLNSKVYRYLGIVEEPESYKELTTSGTISAYNLKIQEKNSYTADGEIFVALVASADENLLAADRSPDMLKEQEIAQKAIDLVLMGDECMKKNKDLDGLRYYLQSMVYSYGLTYIEDEYSFSAMLEEVFSVLDELNIAVSREEPEDAKCRLKITRNATLIPSRVKDSEIKATFDSTDALGNSIVDSFTYTTDSNGVINFVPMTYNFSMTGTVVFSFDFETEIKDIENLSPYTASSIKSAVEAKSVGFSYNRKSTQKPIAVCVQSVDYKGDSNQKSWLTDFIIDKYADIDIEAFAFDYIEDESEQELLRRFKDSFPDGNDIIVLRVGAGSIFETRMGMASVGAEGSVVVYSADTGEVLYDSGISYANGFGESLEEAQKTSFENFILKMLTLLKAYYV